MKGFTQSCKAVKGQVELTFEIVGLRMLVELINKGRLKVADGQRAAHDWNVEESIAKWAKFKADNTRRITADGMWKFGTTIHLNWIDDGKGGKFAVLDGLGRMGPFLFTNDEKGQEKVLRMTDDIIFKVTVYDGFDEKGIQDEMFDINGGKAKNYGEKELRNNVLYVNPSYKHMLRMVQAKEMAPIRDMLSISLPKKGDQLGTSPLKLAEVFYRVGNGIKVGDITEDMKKFFTELDQTQDYAQKMERWTKLLMAIGHFGGNILRMPGEDHRYRFLVASENGEKHLAPSGYFEGRAMGIAKKPLQHKLCVLGTFMSSLEEVFQGDLEKEVEFIRMTSNISFETMDAAKNAALDAVFPASAVTSRDDLLESTTSQKVFKNAQQRQYFKNLILGIA